MCYNIRILIGTRNLGHNLPGGGRLVVQPEGHPGNAHDHEGRHVDGHHVVGQLDKVGGRQMVEQFYLQSKII